MAEPTAGRVRVPRLVSSSRTMWLSAAVAVVGVIAVVAWALATQSTANRVAAVVVAVILVLFLVFLAGRRTSLDTARGTVVRDVWGLPSRAEAWAGAQVVRVRSNNAGQAQLEVRGAGHRTSVYLGLVAVDLGGDRSQPPEFLRTLADQIEQWTPERAAVARSLRAQADHLEGGGAVRDSPLARRFLVAAR
jgi:hypothetical protein